MCQDGHATLAPVGYWYISDSDEIGIHCKYLTHVAQVLRWILRAHPDRRLMMNVAIKNYHYKRMARAHGGKRVQETYVWTATR